MFYCASLNTNCRINVASTYRTSNAQMTEKSALQRVTVSAYTQQCSVASHKFKLPQAWSASHVLMSLILMNHCDKLEHARSLTQLVMSLNRSFHHTTKTRNINPFNIKFTWNGRSLTFSSNASTTSYSVRSRCKYSNILRISLQNSSDIQLPISTPSTRDFEGNQHNKCLSEYSNRIRHWIAHSTVSDLQTDALGRYFSMDTVTIWIADFPNSHTISLITVKCNSINFPGYLGPFYHASDGATPQPVFTPKLSLPFSLFLISLHQ